MYSGGVAHAASGSKATIYVWFLLHVKVSFQVLR